MKTSDSAIQFNQYALVISLLISAVISGCATSNPTANFEDSIRTKLSLFAEPEGETNKDSIPGPELTANIGRIEAHLLKAPNPVIQHWTNPLGELKDPKAMTVGMKVIDRHFDQNNVYFTVLLRNTADEGARIRLYAFGYDTNNRLLNTGDKALYLQPREQMVQKYTFNRSAGMTRWMLALR